MKKRFTIIPLVAIGMLLASCGISTPATPSDPGGDPTVTTYTVNYATSSDYTVNGLKSSYTANEKVEFTVTVTNAQKEIETVKQDITVLTAVNNKYSFNMPSSNVTLYITLKDKGTPTTTYTVSYSTSSDYTVNGIKSSYVANEAVEFTVTVTNANKEIDTVKQNNTVLTLTNNKYSFNMPSSNVTLTITLKDKGSPVDPVDPSTVTEFTLVTSNKLEIGSIIVFSSVSSGSTKLMGSQGNNNRAAVDASISDNTINITGKGAYTFLVEEGTKTGTYSFKDTESNEYLYAAGSSKNLLKSTKTKTDDASFTYSYSASGCSIVAQGTNTRNQMYYNSTNGIFSCYQNKTGDDSYYMPFIFEGLTEKIYPTDFEISGSSSVDKGKTTALSVSFTPSDTNQKTITWSSDDETIATVNDGTIRGVEVGSTVIRASAKKEDGSSINKSFNITVAPVVEGAWTILMYMCGTNLESDYANKDTITQNGKEYPIDGIGLATADILEILSVPNKPNDVNIVIETGGATEWTNNTYGKYSNGYSISSDSLQRHHVENQKIVLDETLDTYTSMGDSSTLESFVEYGLTSYPAEKTALVLWNHGGAMAGVCFDYKKSQEGLDDNEVLTAVSNALSHTGKSKLEWIGYDACLMAVQDIAEKNSAIANYMVAAQESELGDGWAYSGWIDDLYNKKPTETILTEICDSFIASIETMLDSWESEDGYRSANDQTLAWFDLSKASAYKNAWETMASSIATNIGSLGSNAFIDYLNNSVKSYGGTTYTYAELQAVADEWTEDYPDEFPDGCTVEDVTEYYELVQFGSVYCEVNTSSYGTFDALDFLTKVKAHATLGKNVGDLIDNCISALNELIGYKKVGKDAGNSNGICMYFPTSKSSSGFSRYYTSSMTNFTNWRSICYTYGG